MVRCFIGVLVPEEVKEEAEKVKKNLSNLEMKCKFVEGENLHICFSFLGETDENKISFITKTLDSICKDFLKFEVSLGGIKMIPSESYIRVLALDIIEKTGKLKNLTKVIQEKVGGDSKPPHLTLCRVKSIKDKQSTAQKIREIKVETIDFTIPKIQLIKSELRRGGPVYTPLHESSLML